VTLRDVEKEMAKPRIVESVRRATTGPAGAQEARNALRSVLRILRGRDGQLIGAPAPSSQTDSDDLLLVGTD